MLVRLVVLLSAIPFAGCAALGPMSPLNPVERALIFHPTGFPEGEWRPHGVVCEDAWFQASDGTRLHGWFIPHPRPRAIALFMHGNAGNIASRAESLRILNQRHGLAVMTFDYRGYGKSEGTPTEKGILQDARAARDWLARRCGVTPQSIILMGRSLGGGVAVDLAARDGARALVLASTFTSLPDVGAHHFPWLPTRLMMTHKLDSLAKIRDFRGPLLQSHGDADQVIPYEQGRRLFDAAPGPKRFVTIPGGGHNSPQTDEYRRELDLLLDSLNPMP